MAAPPRALDLPRLQRADDSSLQRLARQSAAGLLEWRQADGRHGPLGAQWLDALRAATRLGAASVAAPADASEELSLWSGERLLARLLLRGDGLWICESAAGACEERLGRSAELQTLWQPALRRPR